MGGVRALAVGRPEPIAIRGHDEFAGLARAFNEMGERLEAAHRRLVEETEARLELARQLQQAEQLVVAGRIASEVAHEIGTPPNVISGRAESLLRDLPAEDPQAKPLRAILAQIDRIRAIMMSLLDVVRPRKPEIQPVGVAELVGSVAELLRPTARARGLTLVTDLVPKARAMADPYQLQQIVINLLINAIEATPAGGRITLEARPAPGAAGEPGAELGVVDNGTGIAPEHLARVFEPFFTTKPPGQGTGLGLAICREIVREHGGVIMVESRPGAGTTVDRLRKSRDGHLGDAPGRLRLPDQAVHARGGHGRGPAGPRGPGAAGREPAAPARGRAAVRLGGPHRSLPRDEGGPGAPPHRGGE